MFRITDDADTDTVFPAPTRRRRVSRTPIAGAAEGSMATMPSHARIVFMACLVLT